MEEDNFIPISYISQYNYCKRRAGLLLLEQQWNDSSDTVKGSLEHKNVHTASITSRNSIITVTDMSVVSHKLNLMGKCDAVEAVLSDNGTALPWIGSEKYELFPIEYKHGSIRTEPEYEYQLCAQAMCMEEMFGCSIRSGAIFFISSHRNHEVIFTKEHREAVEKTAFELSQMLENKLIPKADYSPKCLKCSLKDICLPKASDSISDYLKSVKQENEKGDKN
ncbi:MAG: CRISPR-associated protein Cas4 [Oscillospiraceae bacterium]|nr:CRISPR-associated protein Cas4 [Oscillospiraceae bacterium]